MKKKLELMNTTLIKILKQRIKNLEEELIKQNKMNQEMNIEIKEMKEKMNILMKEKKEKEKEEKEKMKVL